MGSACRPQPRYGAPARYRRRPPPQRPTSLAGHTTAGSGVHGQVLVSDPVAEAIRKELWRQIGHRVDTPEIVRLLSETLLRPSGLQG